MGQVILKGDRQLQRKLKALGKKAQKQIARKATRAGAKVILKEARLNARTDVGGDMGELLAKYLKIMTYRKQRKGSHALAIGMSAAGNPYFVVTSKAGRRNYIPAAIEYGHRLPGRGGAEATGMIERLLHRVGIGGERTVGAIPFMRRAHDMKAMRAMRVARATMRRLIEAEARK